MRLPAAALLVLAMTLPVRTEPVAAAVPSIEIQPREGGVSIVGHILALTGGDFDGRMTVKKSGTSGKTVTAQGSTFSLAKGKTTVVATIMLSLQADDNLDIALLVSSNGRELATSTIHLDHAPAQ